MKKITSIILAGVMLVALVGCGSNKKTDTTTDTAKVDDNKKSATKEETKEAPKIFNFGEVGSTDKWEVKVLEVTENSKVPANDKYDEELITQEKFVAIKLELKNISSNAISYSGNDFGLAAQKSVYKIDDVGFKALQKLNNKETIYNKNTSFVSVYTDINPGMTKNTYIAFNVPKDLDVSSCMLGVVINRNNAIYMKLK